MAARRGEGGCLEPYVEGFRSRLPELGYTVETVWVQVRWLRRLGRWLSAEGLEASDLSEVRVETYLAARRISGGRWVEGVGCYRALLDYLRGEGVIAVTEVPPPTELEQLVARYRDWLVRDRGLAPATVQRYERLAHRFLQERASGGDGLDVEELGGGEVAAFLLSECARLTVDSAKGKVAELRSLMRFLYLEGLTQRQLAVAVPPVRGWSGGRVPPFMSARDVQALLDSCDRSHPMGMRDFAILKLLARLGLRSVEVARLELGDLDWRAGELVVRGKARRDDRLPLPADVGEALSAYLREGRPRDERRWVFLTVRAPRRPFRPDLCSHIVRRACRRAGLAPVGPHRLRHALATELLGRGADLLEISQVFRHRDLATTALYAKVDLGRLRQVARPWPGVER